MTRLAQEEITLPCDRGGLGSSFARACAFPSCRRPTIVYLNKSFFFPRFCFFSMRRTADGWRRNLLQGSWHCRPRKLA